MNPDIAEKTVDSRRKKFDTLWKTLNIDGTAQFDADRTRTMRPATDLVLLDTDTLLGELPWLTQNKTQVEFAEIQLGELIGAGGMGAINLAHQRSVAREVAVKSLHPKHQDPESVLTLLREGWITGRLEHPNIVPIYSLGRGDDGQPIIVMKKVAGVSLTTLIEDPSASPRALGNKQPLDFYIEILAQVCNAVHYAHSRGILHRDIKPDNIMVGEFGEVYLLDWGIAVSLEETHRGRLPIASQITSPAGTPAYMAPEMVSGDGTALSEKTDIFLLGAVLHEILTGEPPNKGGSLFQIMFDAYNPTPTQYEHGVDAQLAAICHQAMHAEPQKRFESADALRNALETHLGHRDSLRIGMQSHTHLADLREMIAREVTPSSDDATESDEVQREQSSHAIYRRFGACRFGFEQALETSPENEAARRGLQEVIELLVEREIQQGAYHAASLLITDLPEPNHDLTERLSKLGQQLETRDREFEGLKRSHFEHNTAVGRRSRSTYAAVLGILLGALAILSRLIIHWAGYSSKPSALMLHSLVILVTALIPTIIARRALMQNRINRRIVYLLFVALIYAAVFRGLGLLLAFPPSSVVVMEMTGHSAIGLVAGLFADRQLLWFSGSMGLGALTGALFPAYAIPALVFSIFGRSPGLATRRSLQIEGHALALNPQTLMENPMRPVDTKKAQEAKRQKFQTLWEALSLEVTQQFDADRTRTMRPATDLALLDTDILLGELPWLTQNKTQVEFAEIQLGELIGAGGMGAINLAHQRSVAREVAVKSLHPKHQDPESVLTLLREGWVTGRLEHPNIVPIYTLGRGDDGQPIIVMKKIAGVSLATLIEDPSASPRALGNKQPLDFYIEILAQVCNAVHYAHSRGILHRDIKPDNIMVGEFGEVYLLDWGIAVSLKETHRGRLPIASQITSPAGTPAYMAPEMVSGDGAELSEKTDIFLLGALLHEILTGEPPNKGGTLFQIMFDAYNTTPAEYEQEIDTQLAAICHRAMHAEPDKRFATADALRNALETHLSHRDSLRLGEQSHRRLETLREMIDREAALDSAQSSAQHEQSSHAIYRLFGACRFGFEQALETSPENKVARRGLQQAIELLVEREIRHGAHRAAALLIADLPEPNQNLERRLGELGDRLESRDREFEGLKKDQFEQNLEVGRRSRSIYAAVLAILMGGIAVLVPLFTLWSGIAITPITLLLHSLLVTATALVPTVLARRALMRNSANRNIIYVIFLSLIYAILLRGLGVVLGMPVSTILVMEMVLYSATSMIEALFADRQLLWFTAAIAAGAVLGGFNPTFAIEILGISLMIGFSAIALAWRRVDRCKYDRCKDERGKDDRFG